MVSPWGTTFQASYKSLSNQLCHLFTAGRISLQDASSILREPSVLTRKPLKIRKAVLTSRSFMLTSHSAGHPHRRLNFLAQLNIGRSHASREKATRHGGGSVSLSFWFPAERLRHATQTFVAQDQNLHLSDSQKLKPSKTPKNLSLHPLQP